MICHNLSYKQKKYNSFLNNFIFNKKELENFERKFLHESGVLLGAYQHIESEEKQTWIIEALSQEALKSSEIEGEILKFRRSNPLECRKLPSDKFFGLYGLKQRKIVQK